MAILAIYVHTTLVVVQSAFKSPFKSEQAGRSSASRAAAPGYHQIPAGAPPFTFCIGAQVRARSEPAFIDWIEVSRSTLATLFLPWNRPWRSRRDFQRDEAD